ncbi:hypothetical protein [Actinomadura sp. CNU-125]|uniref:hypothetical protein n=1 Tax=Actinomadura sp. CNU-125 TaxID=1904961 RepID=UPI001177CA0A|nr:hypothetical protein [Actinomadura sp. CNU-125]
MTNRPRAASTAIAGTRPPLRGDAPELRAVAEREQPQRPAVVARQDPVAQPGEGVERHVLGGDAPGAAQIAQTPGGQLVVGRRDDQARIGVEGERGHRPVMVGEDPLAPPGPQVPALDRGAGSGVRVGADEQRVGVDRQQDVHDLARVEPVEFHAARHVPQPDEPVRAAGREPSGPGEGDGEGRARVGHQRVAASARELHEPDRALPRRDRRDRVVAGQAGGFAVARPVEQGRLGAGEVQDLQPPPVVDDHQPSRRVEADGGRAAPQVGDRLPPAPGRGRQRLQPAAGLVGRGPAHEPPEERSVPSAEPEQQLLGQLAGGEAQDPGRAAERDRERAHLRRAGVVEPGQAAGGAVQVREHRAEIPVGRRRPGRQDVEVAQEPRRLGQVDRGFLAVQQVPDGLAQDGRDGAHRARIAAAHVRDPVVAQEGGGLERVVARLRRAPRHKPHELDARHPHPAGSDHPITHAPDHSTAKRGSSSITSWNAASSP